MVTDEPICRRKAVMEPKPDWLLRKKKRIRKVEKKKERKKENNRIEREKKTTLQMKFCISD